MRVKVQKMAQNDKKNSICRALHLMKHTPHDLDLWYTCEKG